MGSYVGLGLNMFLTRSILEIGCNSKDCEDGVGISSQGCRRGEGGDVIAVCATGMV